MDTKLHVIASSDNTDLGIHATGSPPSRVELGEFPGDVGLGPSAIWAFTTVAADLYQVVAYPTLDTEAPLNLTGTEVGAPVTLAPFDPTSERQLWTLHPAGGPGSYAIHCAGVPGSGLRTATTVPLPGAGIELGPVGDDPHELPFVYRVNVIEVTEQGRPR